MGFKLLIFHKVPADYQARGDLTYPVGGLTGLGPAVTGPGVVVILVRALRLDHPDLEMLEFWKRPKIICVGMQGGMLALGLMGNRILGKTR